MDNKPSCGRKSIRLKDYDYSSQGGYFVTLCVQDRRSLFGEIGNAGMQMNELGKCAADCWEWLGKRNSFIELDVWTMMPNHLHGILIIDAHCRGASRCAHGEGAGGSRTAPTAIKPLGRLIGAFKTVSTKRINGIHGTPGAVLWQRNYWERVIRDIDELNRIREYIHLNPGRWLLDKENPQREATVIADDDAFLNLMD